MRGLSRWRTLLLVSGIIPVGLALAPRPSASGPLPAWQGRGRGEVRVEPVGPNLVLPGTVRAATQTAITPEVQQLADLPRSFGILGLVAPTRIIELLPEGSPVREGQVICRLDPSLYEDRARAQRIEVAYARSAHAEAARALAVAEAALVAFRDGDRVQRERQLETERALARVELSRAEDSLAWSTRMGALGYIAAADLGEGRLSRLRAEVARDRAEVALETFRRSTASTQLRDFEARVEQARTQLAFAAEDLGAAEQRLEHLEGQVSHCTITAPHDGTVFYADNAWREYYQIREGADVYPQLPLFVLPDLSRMEVETRVHERFAALVSEGQRATVSFAAFPGRSYTARVTTVDLLPTPDWYHFGEWQQFRVRLTLDEAPEDLLPEMTAEIDLAVGPARSALTVPSEAVGWDDAGPFCVVASPSGTSRRAVRVDRGTADRLVVLDGLEPGEVVLIAPRPVGDHPQ